MFAALALMTLCSDTLTNPVWPDNFPDPHIVQSGDDFYAFATQTAGVSGGFQVMKSKDLVKWQHLGGVNRPDWAVGQLWAPEVYKWKGKWYMFFSAKDRSSQKRDLGVSVADSPVGPYRFVAKLVLGTSENAGAGDGGAIDGTVYFEGGKPFLLYIREAAPRSLKIVPLSEDFSKTVGEAKVLLKVDRTIEQGILDAPTLVKHGGVYWLFYSTGWFQSSIKDAAYQVWAAKSDSIFGPYVKPEKPVLASKAGETLSPGHQCLIQLKSGEWWMGYHGWDSSAEPRYGKNLNGRTLRLDRLEWTKSGPVVLGPTVLPQAAPRIR